MDSDLSVEIVSILPNIENGVDFNDYQDARDVVTLGIVSDLQHYDTQLKKVDKQLEQMYHALGCTLTTIPGVNIITAVKIMAEIVS